MRIRIAAALLIVLVTMLSSAATSKEIWQLTDDERIEARLDPQKMRERAASHAVRVRRLQDSGASSSNLSIGTDGDGTPTTLVIDGTEHPELFLPFELFDHLIRGVDTTLTAQDQQAARAILEPEIRDFGYEPDAFWNALGITTHRYFVVRDGARVYDGANQPHTSNPQSDAIQSPSGAMDRHIDPCRERLTALNAARDHFGHESFDRFLYTAVAPTLTIASRAPTSSEAACLRYLSGGCE